MNLQQQPTKTLYAQIHWSRMIPFLLTLEGNSSKGTTRCILLCAVQGQHGFSNSLGLSQPQLCCISYYMPYPLARKNLARSLATQRLEIETQITCSSFVLPTTSVYISGKSDGARSTTDYADFIIFHFFLSFFLHC